MLQIREVPLGDKNIFRDTLDSLFEQIQFACKSHQFDVIYDSYLESPIKGCERVRRAKSIAPVEYTLLMAATNILV